MVQVCICFTCQGVHVEWPGKDKFEISTIAENEKSLLTAYLVVEVLNVLSSNIFSPQDYIYPEARDRQFLNYFHQKSKKQRFNVDQYNKLKEDVAEVVA